MMGGYPGGYPGMGFDPRGFQGQPGGSPAAIQFQQQQMAQYQQQMAAEHQARALAARRGAGDEPGSAPQPERGVPGFVDAATSAGAAQGGADAPRAGARRRTSVARRRRAGGNPWPTDGDEPTITTPSPAPRSGRNPSRERCNTRCNTRCTRCTR